MRAMRVVVVLAAAVTAASAVPPPPPEYGLRGLERLEVAFVDARGGRRVAGEVDVDPPMETDRDCREIGPTLALAGIEVVERCAADDAACGTLFVALETDPDPGGELRVYLAEVSVSQPVRLVRDPTVDLSVPTTWSERRYGIVPVDRPATRMACIQLRDLATWFTAIWKAENR